MDKVKIQEIADEAGLSNGDLLEKAKALGFDVKAANSTISMEDAGILVDYAISGTLPKGFKKPGTKAKIKVVKKKEEDAPQEAAPEVNEAPEAEEVKVEAPKVEEVVEAAAPVVEESVAPEIVEETPESEAKEAVEEVVVVKEETAAEEKVVEEPAPEVVEAPAAPKEVKKRKGISVVSKKAEPAAASENGEEKPKRRVLSRTGIKIVRKAKPAPVRSGTTTTTNKTFY